MTPAQSLSPTIVIGVTTTTSLELLGNLPRQLTKLGWAVHIVCDLSESDISRFRDWGVFHSIRMSRTASVLRDIIGLVEWAAYLDRVKPDVLYVGTPKASLLGLLAGKITRVPSRIYILRGLRLESETGLKRRLLWIFERLSSKLSTHIIPVSKSLQSLYVELGLAENDAMYPISHGSSHGVDLVRFNRANWKHWNPPQPAVQAIVSDNSPTIGFVGRFSRDKGAKVLLEVRDYLESRNLRFSLLIVGPIEDSDEVAHKLMQGPNPALFVGHVEDTAPYFSIIDFLLLPTRREGFPNVIIEAAASGVPTVASKATGTVDAIINGQTGILVNLQESWRFGEVSEQLIQDESLRARLANAARDRATTLYNEKDVIVAHANFIMSVIENERTMLQDSSNLVKRLWFRIHKRGRG